MHVMAIGVEKYLKYIHWGRNVTLGNIFHRQKQCDIQANSSKYSAGEADGKPLINIKILNTM